MEDVLFKRISSDPRYIELKRKRTRFGWWLTLSMMVVYYGFIVLVAFVEAARDENEVTPIAIGGEQCSRSSRGRRETWRARSYPA